MKVLLVATLLLFSGYGLLLANSWRDAALTTGIQTASTVGVFAGVPENEVNRYMAQLTEREAQLVLREEALASAPATDTRTLLLITLIGAGLLGLILLNFYLDMHRRRYITV
jgi:hypothetical protein